MSKVEKEDALGQPIHVGDVVFTSGRTINGRGGNGFFQVKKITPKMLKVVNLEDANKTELSRWDFVQRYPNDVLKVDFTIFASKRPLQALRLREKLPQSEQKNLVTGLVQFLKLHPFSEMSETVEKTAIRLMDMPFYYLEAIFAEPTDDDEKSVEKEPEQTEQDGIDELREFE